MSQIQKTNSRGSQEGFQSERQESSLGSSGSPAAKDRRPGGAESVHRSSFSRYYTRHRLQQIPAIPHKIPKDHVYRLHHSAISGTLPHVPSSFHTAPGNYLHAEIVPRARRTDLPLRVLALGRLLVRGESHSRRRVGGLQFSAWACRLWWWRSSRT